MPTQIDPLGCSPCHIVKINWWDTKQVDAISPWLLSDVVEKWDRTSVFHCHRTPFVFENSLTRLWNFRRIPVVHCPISLLLETVWKTISFADFVALLTRPLCFLLLTFSRAVVQYFISLQKHPLHHNRRPCNHFRGSKCSFISILASDQSMVSWCKNKITLPVWCFFPSNKKFSGSQENLKEVHCSHQRDAVCSRNTCRCLHFFLTNVLKTYQFGTKTCSGINIRNVLLECVLCLRETQMFRPKMLRWNFKCLQLCCFLLQATNFFEDAGTCCESQWHFYR